MMGLRRYFFELIVLVVVFVWQSGVLVGQAQDSDDVSRAVPVAGEVPDENLSGDSRSLEPLIPMPAVVEEIKQLPEELKARVLETDDQTEEGGAEILDEVRVTLGLPAELEVPLVDGAGEILLPYRPKPILPAPIGWTFRRADDSVKNWQTELILADGKTIKLEITPYLLAPASLGGLQVAVDEPGFSRERVDGQSRAIGGILVDCKHELDAVVLELDEALAELDELLLSLPEPRDN